MLNFFGPITISISFLFLRFESRRTPFIQIIMTIFYLIALIALPYSKSDEMVFAALK
jgi:hypothetical protein